MHATKKDTGMPVIRDTMGLPGRRETIYPQPLDAGFEGRIKRALTEGLGLSQFGINLTTLEPGARSSHRHWHVKEDEAVYILSGEVVLVTNQDEQTLTAGMAAGFPAGAADGHHLINRSTGPATYLEIGTRSPEEDATYPDVDLVGVKRAGQFRFFHKTGEPYA
jgi:uncharacterized cupin superfamily protein